MKSCGKCNTTHPTGLFCDHGHVLKEEGSEDTLVGRILDERYEVRSALGGGGFGMVYLGAQLRLEDRPCVIKVARPELAQDAQFAARFEREKRALMALRSRNTVQILDYGRTDDAIDYIVMEFIEGDELGHLLRRRGPMQPKRVIAIARGLCNSLIEAHGVGILHRDLKPGNVMLVDLGTSELVKVIDFGIARLAGGGDFQTRTGELPGTPAYSPYEQLIGQVKNVDERTDIYSFGAILYEALTGVVPYGDLVKSRDFDSNTLYFLALAQAKAGETATPPSRLATSQIPPLFEQLVVSMLHKTREQRPSSAQEVLDILQRIERIDATGSGTIEVDETVMAPLSEPGSAPQDSRRSADTEYADSETLDSAPAAAPTAADTVQPRPKPATVQPEVDEVTRVPTPRNRGLVWGGGATIAALLAVVGFLVLGPPGERPEVVDPSPTATKSEQPVAAHPAGIPQDLDVATQGDTQASDMTPVPAETRTADDIDSPELAAVPLQDVSVVPEQAAETGLAVPALPLTDAVAMPQDATAPEPEEVSPQAPKEAPPEQSSEELRKKEARREKRKKEREKLKNEAKAAAKETPPPVEEKVVEPVEKPSEPGDSGKVNDSGAKNVEKPPEEKAVEVIKEDPKPPIEEKKALHKRLDFMDDEE